jgi:YYY domain-containing protein
MQLDVAANSPARWQPRGMSISRSDVLVGLILVVVMLVGGYFRFVGQNWDDFVRFHPDERFLSGVVANMGGPLNFTGSDLAQQYQNCLARYPETGGRGGFFDAACSPMNPHNTGNGLMVYGTLPAFLVRWAADIVVQLTGDTTFGTYTSIHLVGRALSALAEMGVILTVFFIGLQLHDKWIGVLAAALYGATVFSIQQAHFWTADAMTNLFCVLAIWSAARVQMGSRLWGYLLFGLFFGMALASRINTAPLVLLLLLAAGLHMLPVFDRRLAWDERGRLITTHMTGLVLAGVITLLAFRIFNPYAFSGPGFFGIMPNQRWLDDLAQAQHLVSGNAESPPNWQWVGRAAYIFPFTNMSLWGMGIALALAGWGAWLWSGWRLLRGRPGALRNLLPFVWILVYFAWLGNLWVMSMRYYLPMYPMFALLAAWGLIEMVRRANRSEIAWRKLAAGGLLALVVSFTALWAVMFTNIYRHLFSPAAASYWIIENISADFSMRVEGVDASLINIAVFNRPGSDDVSLDQQASQYATGQIFNTAFTAPADGIVTHIHSPHLGDPLNDPDTETIIIKISGSNSNVVLAEGTLTADLTREQNVLGNAYDIPLDTPLQVKQGETYSFSLEVVDGPVISGGAIFTWEGDWDEPVPPKVCALPQGITLADDPPPGLSDANDCNGQDLWSAHINGYKLQVYWEEELYKIEYMQRALDNTDYLIIGTNRRYDSQSRIPYRWPMTMRYYETLFSGELGFELVETFQRTFELGPLKVSDQYLPTYDAPAWLNEFEAEEAFHVYDHPVVYIFRKTDAYSSENTARILGSVPLNKADVVYGSFNDPTLVGVVPLYSVPADPIPTALQLTPDLRHLQYDNGTWSSRFDSDSPISTQPVVSILVWWLTMMVVGWAAWPLLYVAFPGLADRGYGLSKIAGLLLIGWIPWVISSARIPVWSQLGVLGTLIAVAVVSLLMIYRRRESFTAYLRENAGRLMWIEAITLMAFVFFLLIRLTNPDLWHPALGGEKPMDFAYFNGVLRSSVFPPIDPWYAGGYINYYYYGYVTVGAPVLLLGMVPSIAYNLIIPTLFAVTGIAAFSVAFNVVSAWQPNNAPGESVSANPNVQSPPGDDLAQDPLEVKSEEELGNLPRPAEARSFWSKEEVMRIRRAGNPWVAGIAALLLAVVLGNLDTPRVFVVEGLLNTGFYEDAFGAESYLISEYTAAHNGVLPTGEDMARISQQAREEAASPALSAFRGLSRVLKGEPLNLAPNRWYWAPTRIIMEAPVSAGGAIAEMPFFTFLYGDLHAHMIAMPMLFLVMGFVLNEVLVAGQDSRGRFAVFLSLFIGALSAGLLRATNTWDWVTFMLLSVLGLGFAWWLGLKWLNRNTRTSLVLRVGCFVALSFLVALPYTTWYASIYSSVRPYTDTRSPIWTYLTIHGMFLFLILGLLVWDTGRWLRSVYVRSLRGMGLLLAAVFVVLLALLMVIAILSFVGVSPFPPTPVTIIAAPLLIWVAILFLRQGQSREMRYVLALAGLALGLTLGVEYVVLEGDIGRQNTVFKFYIQAWLLFSVVGGTAAAWLIQSSSRWSVGLKVIWYSVLSLLFFVAALYPLMATRGRSLDRMGIGTPFTLDGMTYMLYSSQAEGNPAITAVNPELGYFSLKDDYDIIRWLQENVQGTPVIMEGRSSGSEYKWNARISIYTGLPSVLGWNWHQRQQRTFDPLPRLVSQREANVNAFYTTTNIDTAWSILERYDVSYIIVSGLERAYYAEEGLAKFDQMVTDGLLEVAYETGTAKVYRVNKDENFHLVGDARGGI